MFPRGWRGAVLSNNAVVTIENLDPAKRPLLLAADLQGIRDVVRVVVRDDLSSVVRLLFDPDHAMEERILREQFAS
jgi:NAD+ kinase